jgi:hypothetical protein
VLPPLRRAGLHVIEMLEHNVEHVARVGLHSSLGVLEPGKMGMGRVGEIHHELPAGDGGFDTSVSTGDRR